LLSAQNHRHTFCNAAGPDGRAAVTGVLPWDDGIGDKESTMVATAIAPLTGKGTDQEEPRALPATANQPVYEWGKTAAMPSGKHHAA